MNSLIDELSDIIVLYLQEFAELYLLQYNKKMDNKQLINLVFKSKMNPLWLKIACEELRIYGDFATINNCIQALDGESLSAYVSGFTC